MRNIMIIISLFVFSSLSVNATYIQEELFVIEWGEENSQLKLEPPYSTPPDTFPGYVTDGELSSGSGPNKVFVDRDENFIFSSYDFGQIKGFSNNGELIFNFSSGETQYDPEIHRGQPEEIYVDSLFRLYIVNFPGWNFVPVVDYEGNVLEKLNPHAPDTNVRIVSLYGQYNGEISFYSFEYGYYTYNNSVFFEGGTGRFLASNGTYYSAGALFPDTIEFIRSENPDNKENAAVIERISKVYPFDSLYVAKILAGGDGSSLYVLIRMDYQGGDEIWEFDLEYNLVDRIKLECWTEEAVWNIAPFIGHDGSVYEFRCFEDGMHVIRWRKE